MLDPGCRVVNACNRNNSCLTNLEQVEINYRREKE
jgi:hypothetical protein